MQIAGIKKHITFHCSRHTFAIHALNSGIPLKVVSLIMGHKSIAITEKIYAKYIPSTIDVEMKKMDTLKDS
jgi:integrase